MSNPQDEMKRSQDERKRYEQEYQRVLREQGPLAADEMEVAYTSAYREGLSNEQAYQKYVAPRVEVAEQAKKSQEAKELSAQQQPQPEPKPQKWTPPSDYGTVDYYRRQTEEARRRAEMEQTMMLTVVRPPKYEYEPLEPVMDEEGEIVDYRVKPRYEGRGTLTKTPFSAEDINPETGEPYGYSGTSFYFEPDPDLASVVYPTAVTYELTPTETTLLRYEASKELGARGEQITQESIDKEVDRLLTTKYATTMEDGSKGYIPPTSSSVIFSDQFKEEVQAEQTFLAEQEQLGYRYTGKKTTLPSGEIEYEFEYAPKGESDYPILTPVSGRPGTYEGFTESGMRTVVTISRSPVETASGEIAEEFKPGVGEQLLRGTLGNIVQIGGGTAKETQELNEALKEATGLKSVDDYPVAGPISVSLAKGFVQVAEATGQDRIEIFGNQYTLQEAKDFIEYAERSREERPVEFYSAFGTDVLLLAAGARGIGGRSAKGAPRLPTEKPPTAKVPSGGSGGKPVISRVASGSSATPFKNVTVNLGRGAGARPFKNVTIDLGTGTGQEVNLGGGSGGGGGATFGKGGGSGGPSPRKTVEKPTKSGVTLLLEEKPVVKTEPVIKEEPAPAMSQTAREIYEELEKAETVDPDAIVLDEKTVSRGGDIDLITEARKRARTKPPIVDTQTLLQETTKMTGQQRSRLLEDLRVKGKTAVDAKERQKLLVERQTELMRLQKIVQKPKLRAEQVRMTAQTPQTAAIQAYQQQFALKTQQASSMRQSSKTRSRTSTRLQDTFKIKQPGPGPRRTIIKTPPPAAPIKPPNFGKSKLRLKITEPFGKTKLEKLAIANALAPGYSLLGKGDQAKGAKYLLSGSKRKKKKGDDDFFI